MKTTRISNGYKLEYKGIIKYVSKGIWGWIMYDDKSFCYGGGCGLETLRGQKESLTYMVDNGLV